ncbi:MAG TPA: cysteine desulfurase family protein [Fimbriimonadaceae bacterium]|nr:cysteine desulfurase family protein [Fimbriimonadaceae bacterium]
MRRIYLDHAATTPLVPEVREAMAPWLEREFGNPSSLHEEGRRARAAIDQARETLSGRLGCLFAEVLFTSSGTEAANLAIVGAALANEDSSRRRVLMGAAEHHCVLHTRPLLERLGYQVETIPVDQTARVRLDILEEMLGPDVLLVSVMHANNELGTMQPVEEVAILARRHGALYHCDAVQTFGFPDADLVTYSAHKIYGPKGSGAIYIRAGTKVKPLAVGGGQEREMRAGTENVAGIVGFAAAVRALPSHFDSAVRDAFLARLASAGFAPTVSDACETLAGHAHGRFPGIDAETMLIRLDRAGISASSGAACSSGSLEPSHVLLACGYSEKEAREGLRFTFGRSSPMEDAEEAAERVIECAAALRK